MWIGCERAKRALRLAGGVGLLSSLPWGAAALPSAGEALPSGEAPRGAPERFPLSVRITELENDEGVVAVALFASADAFPDQKRALMGQLTRIQKGRANVTFPNLPPGRYAVAVLHDENQNSKMDFNFLGMPLEGYGFSNDASAPFGPPSFDAAAFRLGARPSFVTVKVRYFL
jgi:uncharacterized protein (DUF2141 family)